MSTIWRSHGPGGQFTGGGTMGMGDSVDITINVEYESNVAEGAEADKQEIQTLGSTVQESTSKFGMSKEAANDYSDSLREQISPVRSVSWDLILMGRSVSILNNYFGAHNKIVQEITGVIYGFGAALRIIVTAVDLYRIAVLLTSAIEGPRIAQLATETTAVNTLSASYIGLAGAQSAAGVTGTAIGGIGSFAGIGGLIGLAALQKGGYINQTGPYFLHKGETVVPAGASFSTININMSSGPISSSVDVDNMLNALAKRMLVEQRRRRA